MSEADDQLPNIKNVDGFVVNHGVDVARGYILALEQFTEELNKIIFKGGGAVLVPAQSCQRNAALFYSQKCHLLKAFKDSLDKNSSGIISPEP